MKKKNKKLSKFNIFWLTALAIVLVCLPFEFYITGVAIATNPITIMTIINITVYSILYTCVAITGFITIKNDMRNMQ